ncbi:MAG TPA: 6,7-dimethyl-8-ribityllumazine synthase [Candidatus Omnitrophota bacterium]|nr:6,7-dimethyl-8-ribityllumazine synthase [Candidatus Omnitrophota bacterium]
MKNAYFGKLSGDSKRIAIVVAEFNDFITKRLLDGAVAFLKKAGVKESQIKIIWVPGALEVPFFCKAVKKNLNCDGVIALACVLRGETYHYECVSHEITRGVSQVALESGVSISTGILTLDNLEQAIDRAGLKSGNKGAHAAQALLEMMSLMGQIQSKKKRGRRA